MNTFALAAISTIFRERVYKLILGLKAASGLKASADAFFPESGPRGIRTLDFSVSLILTARAAKHAIRAERSNQAELWAPFWREGLILWL